MNPKLSEFCNDNFYEGKLKNGPTKKPPSSLAPFVEKADTLHFFNLKYGKEQKEKTSYVNHQESKLVASTVAGFIRKDPSLTIGVITPYKAQAKLIESEIIEEIKDERKLENIKVSTVDAFQGQERNIIILSCVRSNNRREVGFVKDPRRLNVSLTRAQNLLIAFGSEDTLNNSPLLHHFIDHTKSKRAFHDLSSAKDENIVRMSLWTKIE